LGGGGRRGRWLVTTAFNMGVRPSLQINRCLVIINQLTFANIALITQILLRKSCGPDVACHRRTATLTKRVRGSQCSLSQSSPIPSTRCTPQFGENRPGTLNSAEATPTTTIDNHRQNENVRRFFLRPADLPRQGTNFPISREATYGEFPTPSPTATR
jgi:hypothetical protein